MQVDPKKSKLKPPGTKRLKLQCHTLLSTSAFKFNLRRYIKATKNTAATAAAAAAATAATAAAATAATACAATTARRRARALLADDMSDSFTAETPHHTLAYHQDAHLEENHNLVTITPIPGRRRRRALESLEAEDEDAAGASRRLLQASAAPPVLPDLEVAAGVQAALQIALADGLGNPQRPNPLRRLDRVTVRFGESTCLNGTCPGGANTGQPACGWQPRVRLLPLLVPTDNCVPVFTSSTLIGGNQTAPVYPAPGVLRIGIDPGKAVQADPVKPKLNPPGTKRLKLKYNELLWILLQFCFQFQLAPLHPGLSLAVVNDFSAGTFNISFAVDRQLPALPDHFYLLEVLLNNEHLGGSPYNVRVVPGRGLHSFTFQLNLSHFSHERNPEYPQCSLTPP